MMNSLPYKIILPADNENGKKYPAIYVLHGIGSNEEDILSLVESVKEDFILISVRGYYEREDGYSHYQIEGFGHPRRESFDQCVDRLMNMIDYFNRTYPIDSALQYVVGFSQGAALAMTLALKMGDRLKGIVALSGYLPSFVKETDAQANDHKVSVFISHGLYDPLFSAREARENARFFESRGHQTFFATYFSRHEVTVENQRDFIQWLYDDLENGFGASR